MSEDYTVSYLDRVVVAAFESSVSTEGSETKRSQAVMPYMPRKSRKWQQKTENEKMVNYLV